MDLLEAEVRSMPAPETKTDHQPIRVAIVEDSVTVRRNLQRWISRAAGFQCVCACANGVEALRLIPLHNPQVVLMDIQMPEMSGVDCVSRLKVILPAVQIIMLTVYEDTETIFKALRAGASGYLLKRCTHEEILQAIRDLLLGGAPMSNAIARKVVAAFHEPVRQENAHVVLSAREREILDLLSEGLSNKEISARLNVSQFTVKNHLAKVFEKLHVRCRTEAVMTYLHPPK
jgi:DNA-binding NarL/FixJ family response regulator